MKMVEAIAKRLADLIAEKNISQYELAKRATIDASTIYNLFHNRIKTITVDTLWLIASALDLTIQEFLAHPLFSVENIEL